MYGLCNLNVPVIESDSKIKLLQMWENAVNTDCSFYLQEHSPENVNQSDSNKKKKTSKEVRIQAHKLILRSVSPVFDSMFKMPPTTTNTFVIDKEISPKIFKKFIRAIYTNELNCDVVDEIVMIYILAQKYQTKDIQRLAANQLIANCKVSGDFVMKIILGTWEYGDILLQQACRQGLSKFGSAILKNANFINLPIEVLNILCTLDPLNIDSEIHLIKAVERYIDHNKGRYENINNLLMVAISSLRFLTLSEEEIRSISFLTNSEKKLLIQFKLTETNTSIVNYLLMNQLPRGKHMLLSTFPVEIVDVLQDGSKYLTSLSDENILSLLEAKHALIKE